MTEAQKQFRGFLAAAVHSLQRAQCSVSDKDFDGRVNELLYADLVKAIQHVCSTIKRLLDANLLAEKNDKNDQDTLKKIRTDLDMQFNHLHRMAGQIDEWENN